MDVGGVIAGSCWQSGCRNGDGVVGDDDDGAREAMAVGEAGGRALLSGAWEATVLRPASGWCVPPNAGWVRAQSSAGLLTAPRSQGRSWD